MKTTLIAIVAIGLVSTCVFFGCSEEKRDKILNAVSDSIRPEEKGDTTPDIVAKQQRKGMSKSFFYHLILSAGRD